MNGSQRRDRFPRAGIGALALLVLLSACAADEPTGTPTFDDGSVTTSPITTSPVTTSAVTTGPAANDLSGFARADVTVAAEPLVVAVADTPVLREQGLMGVTDLVDVDGMLFVFDEEVDARFWMFRVPISLDIWFFGSDGSLLGMETMAPCGDPCSARYSPGVPFRYALETEVGRLDAGATGKLEFSGIEG